MRGWRCSGCQGVDVADWNLMRNQGDTGLVSLSLFGEGGLLLAFAGAEREVQVQRRWRCCPFWEFLIEWCSGCRLSWVFSDG